ncbi:Na+ dependent nucleoside transporter domain protein [Verrucomicrobia bacterium]|jgi:concentrative nucleoside transporter, CNT family|nr:Na+ dependent nucleoside transporter domain protein [bacterium]MDB4798203.1 Na+ dependent nucleoside transporter domain protein [Verrucomicrobiota bacterium]
MSDNITSAFGVLLILGIAWAFSEKRDRLPWRTIGSGLLIQIVLIGLILKTPLGKIVFGFAQSVVLKLNSFANDGAVVIFGPLADATKLNDGFGPGSGPIFAVLISATIIVIAAISSLLYHWGILQRVVSAMAFVMQRFMKTSGSESLAAAANCFIGQTEAPLIIKPYLEKMTRSELLALMTGGMATIAGGVLAVYSQFGQAAGHPELAGHLMTASLISAPGALLIAKILIPEQEENQTVDEAILNVERSTSNGIDALCRGAQDGLKLAVNVMAMMLTFVAVVALVNFVIQWPQSRLGIATPVTLQQIFGWINFPFAWMIGIPLEHCHLIGQILGERIVLNEFFGYLTLTQNEAQIDQRTFVLASYALCGFANFGSIAIQIGGIGTLIPTRRGELATLGWRAMLGGLLTCYLTAALVGVVF